MAKIEKMMVKAELFAIIDKTITATSPILI